MGTGAGILGRAGQSSRHRRIVIPIATLFALAGIEANPVKSRAHSRRPVVVVIVTASRTGSTLFTDLIRGNRSTVFGLYEPFHDAQEGPTTNARRERHWLEDTAVWRSLFDCSFALDNATLQAVAWRGEGRTKLGDQLPWGSEKERVRFRHRRGAISLSRFGPAIHKLCEQSTVRVVKTIRWAGPVRSAFEGWAGTDGAPQVKFIHLVRHPVNAALSHLRFVRQGRWKGPTTLDKLVFKKCVSFRSAMAWLDHAVPPGSVMQVRYEDLVDRPKATLAAVFFFLGVTFDAAVSAHVLSLMAEQRGPKSRLTQAQESALAAELDSFELSPQTRAMCKRINVSGRYSI